MSGYTLTWDDTGSASGAPGAIFQKVNRNLVGGVRDVAVNVPGRDGAWLFQERRGNRTISVQGTMVHSDPTTKRDDLEVMANWLDRSGYKKLIISDQPDRYWEAGLSSDPNPDEWRLLSRFDLQWTAQPYAWALAVSSECSTGHVSGVSDSFTIPDLVDADPVVEITARGSETEGFDLTVNGDVLSYDGFIAQNETVTISSLNETVVAGANTDLELTGVFVSGTVFPADVSGIFPTLNEGLNTFAVQHSGVTVDVCFTWRRRYR